MRLHRSAVGILTAWTAPDDAQETLRQGFLDHLAAHDHGMWRECGHAHITASAVVIDPDERRVLLTLHPKVGLWLQMGGHCEPTDVTLEDAALREAVEESGIAELELLPGPVNLDRHRVRCGGPDHVSEHLDVQYAALAPPRAAERISAESLDLRWFPLDALPEATDEALRRLVTRASALVG